MILNPDILINSGAIKILYERYLKYENVGILAPSLYDNNNNRRTNGSNSRLKKIIQIQIDIILLKEILVMTLLLVVHFL